MNKLHVLMLLTWANHGMAQQICNGYAELCNKRYNEVVQIEAHNATSAPSPEGAIPNAPSLTDDQDVSVQRLLELGVRVFQFHIHYDYKNPMAFYADVLQTKDAELNKLINDRVAQIKRDHAQDFKNLQDAQSQVNSLQNQINDIKHKIDKENKDYNKLPKVSVKGKSQASEAVPHGAKLAGYYTALGSLEAAKKVADAALEVAEKVWNKLLEADPTLIPWRAEKALIDGALKITGPGHVISDSDDAVTTKRSSKKSGQESAVLSITGAKLIEKAQPTGERIEQAKQASARLEAGPSAKFISGGTTITKLSTGKDIFVCHGLPKDELYKNISADDFVRNAPGAIKNIIKPIIEKALNAYKQTITKGVGNKQAGGGIIPYTACLIDNSRRTLSSFLAEIKTWLDNHPTDVITLELNDFRCSGECASNDDIAQIFQKTGIVHYAHTQAQDKLWPTFGELVASNKRLIVFITTKQDEKYPWLMSQNFFFPWQTKFGYSKVSQITNEGSGVDNIFKNSSGVATDVQAIKAGKIVDNKLLRFTHNITQGLAGNKNVASQVNKKSVLLPRLVKIANYINQAPNFIAMDFVEVPNKEAFDAVNEFNGVGRYAGKPAWTKKQ